MGDVRDMVVGAASLPVVVVDWRDFGMTTAHPALLGYTNQSLPELFSSSQVDDGFCHGHPQEAGSRTVPR